MASLVQPMLHHQQWLVSLMTDVDPLLFTCEINESSVLRVTLPNSPPQTLITATEFIPIDGISLVYLDVASLPSPVTGIEESEYTLTDLEVETDYTVTVTATNECGDESPPSTITARIDVREPQFPTYDEPQFFCLDGDKTITLVDIQWMYAALRETTASGLVDVPISSVAVYYTDPASNELIAACSDHIGDEACTCDDVDGSDTFCSLYLPLTDSTNEDRDMIDVVLNVSNDGIVDGVFTESRQTLQSSLLDVDDSGLAESPPTVEVTLTPFCESETQLFARVSFGKRLTSDGDCEMAQSVTIRVEPNQSVMIETTLMLQNNEEYCFAGALLVEEDMPHAPTQDADFLTTDKECESDGLSAGAVAGIAVVVTLLVVLPVGVVLGCCGMWCIMRYSGGPTSDGGQQKVQQLQGAIYEEPSPLVTPIPLTDNQAYGHVHMHSRNL